LLLSGTVTATSARIFQTPLVWLAVRVTPSLTGGLQGWPVQEQGWPLGSRQAIVPEIC
jgi:hypothetical protein